MEELKSIYKLKINNLKKSNSLIVVNHWPNNLFLCIFFSFRNLAKEQQVK